MWPFTCRRTQSQPSSSEINDDTKNESIEVPSPAEDPYFHEYFSDAGLKAWVDTTIKKSYDMRCTIKETFDHLFTFIKLKLPESRHKEFKRKIKQCCKHYYPELYKLF